MIAIPLLTNAPGGTASHRGWIILDDQTGERIDFVDGGGNAGDAALIDYSHRKGALIATCVVTRPIRVSRQEYERWKAADPPRAS